MTTAMTNMGCRTTGVPQPTRIRRSHASDVCDEDVDQTTDGYELYGAII